MSGCPNLGGWLDAVRDGLPASDGYRAAIHAHSPRPRCAFLDDGMRTSGPNASSPGLKNASLISPSLLLAGEFPRSATGAHFRTTGDVSEIVFIE